MDVMLRLKGTEMSKLDMERTYDIFKIHDVIAKLHSAEAVVNFVMNTNSQSAVITEKQIRATLRSANLQSIADQVMDKAKRFRK